MKKQKQRKLRILWNSNSIWCFSGYGNQTHEIVPVIKKAGYDIATIAFYGLEGGVIEWNGIKCYPKLMNAYGDDAMVEHGKDFKPDITIGLQDTWTLNPNLLSQVQNLIFWAPVDHDPIPRVIAEKLRLCYRVISMSKFGEEQMRKQGIHSTYIPHSVNTDIFKNLNKKEELRKEIGVPTDAIIVGMVAANKDMPPRKSFQESMDAFKLFKQKHPKAFMYFHSFVDQQGGFPIRQYAKDIGIAESIAYTPPYPMFCKIDKPQMAKLYNCFDILVAPSISEGFGIPIIEAQSCEVPVVTNNYTSMKELIIPGKTGELCKVHYQRYSPLGSFVGIPDMTSVYEALEKVYENKEEYGKNARQFVIENYDTKIVFKERWEPWLKQVQYEILGY